MLFCHLNFVFYSWIRKRNKISSARHSLVMLMFWYIFFFDGTWGISPTLTSRYAVSIYLMRPHRTACKNRDKGGCSPHEKSDLALAQCQNYNWNLFVYNYFWCWNDPCANSEGKSALYLLYNSSLVSAQI